MNVLNISADQFEAFVLIFLRVSAIVVSAPILGNKNVPAKLKGGLSLMIAFILYPLVPLDLSSFNVFPMIWRMTGEIIIGIIIGMTGTIIFTGIQLTGQLIGFQMGFSIANVVDPSSGTQISIIGQFKYLLALLIFLAVNGHHIFIYAIAESFRIIPPLDFHFSGELTQFVIGLTKNIFIVALKTGAPIIAVLLMTTVGLGVIARTVPQINIFIVGFPMKIAIGLIGMGLSLPVFVKMVGKIMLNYRDEVRMLLHSMG